VAMSPEERERLLAGLQENIRPACARRIAAVDTIEDWNDLVRAAEFDQQLKPLVVRVQAGERAAFDELWEILEPKLQAAIRASLKYYDHFDEVESKVMNTLWNERGKYTEERGFYQPWAGTIARNLAQWYKPGGARNVELHDDHSVPENTALPPSACFAEVLKLVQSERPHYAIAFLFNRYLGWKPERIVLELGDAPLPDALSRLEEEVVSHYPILRGFGIFLGPLRKSLESRHETLSSFVPGEMQPEAAISHWATDTARAVAGVIVRQAKEFLALTCRLRAASHERLSFLWCRLLSRTPAQMASLRDRVLLDILDIFCLEYPPRTTLSADQVARSVGPLKSEIIPRKFLRECEREDLCLDIAQWRDRVQAMLLGPARTEHLLGYAYLCGCLPGNKKKQGGSHDAARKSSANR
jgi:DNA-directed RNA polymerase specialized sigma24 family protein